jgi:hypothetical protein
MARNRNVPDLLERFMKESGEMQRWVTVNEIRTYFDLDKFASPAISGFLQRIYSGPFFSFPYRVERIEKITLLSKPHPRVIKKYLVSRRPLARKQVPALHEITSVIGDIRVSEKG